MNIYDYEAAFGASDKTTRAMRRAMRQWQELYYGNQAAPDRDPCQRIAYSVVTKLGRAVFSEYSALAEDPVVRKWLEELDKWKQQALQLTLMGGECYLKPCPVGTGFSFTLVPRSNMLIFGRDREGEPTDIGTLERIVEGKYFYTLLERRRLEQGQLYLENRLYRSLSDRQLGSQVALSALPQYRDLAGHCRYPLDSLGLVRMKTPMVNCVDGSADGVAVFAPAAGLIRSIDCNEAELSGEFRRGKSRIIVSRDLLDEKKDLQGELFVGLDEDPERVGITLFSPQLREQSFLARKQEYLRNVESVVGLKRGMLSDANMDERTATEIAASGAEYTLTVMDFQTMWEKAVRKAVALCAELAQLYGLAVPECLDMAIDWGNGVLYDEEKVWQGYLEMVREGLLKPEIALGWRFGMKTRTEEDLQAIRERFMPKGETNN